MRLSQLGARTPWRARIGYRVAGIRAELDRPGADEATQHPVAEAARSAWLEAGSPGPDPGVVAATGGDVASTGRADIAWEKLHWAEEQLLLVARPEYVLGVAATLAGGVAGKAATDAEFAAYNEVIQTLLKPSAAAPTPAQREMVRRALWRNNATSDLKQTQTKSLRNTFLFIFVGVALAVAVLALAGAAVPGLFPTCGPAGSGAKLCLDGSSVARPIDLPLLLFVGGAFGLLSAFVFLSSIQAFDNPFHLQQVQLLLKVPVGALTAFAGILGVQSSVFSSLKPSSGAALLLAAAVFGFSQQAVTTWLDRHASNVLGGDATTKGPAKK